MTVRAPAKINVYLGVGKVRPDGFHPLETVYQAVSLYDDVTVTERGGVVGLDAHRGSHVDAARRARRRLQHRDPRRQAVAAHHRLGDRAARIEVRKSIPVAGGMAGGSADAAATLVALDRLWNLSTSDDELLALGAELGSDVPFALVGGTATGTGRGEVVTPVEDNGSWWWVVVFNDEGLSTPSVYGAYDLLEGGDHDLPRPPGPMLETLRAPRNPDSSRCSSTTTSRTLPSTCVPTSRRRRGRARVRAPYALLSGSGPTMLALAADAETRPRHRRPARGARLRPDRRRPRPGGRCTRGG